jgi:hypothetical protein
LKRENKTFQRDANSLFRAEKEGFEGEKVFFTAKEISNEVFREVLLRPKNIKATKKLPQRYR